MVSAAAARRHHPVDAQWAVLAPALPAVSVRGRPPRWTKRISTLPVHVVTAAGRSNRPAGSAPSRTITGWAARGAGGPPTRIWRASRAARSWRSWSPAGSATARSSSGAEQGQGGPPRSRPATQPPRAGGGGQGVHQHRNPAYPRRRGIRGGVQWLLSPQLTAFFTSAPILASSAAVNSVSAKAVGHIVPSSRFALSLKPNVAYLSLNFCAAWK